MDVIARGTKKQIAHLLQLIVVRKNHGPICIFKMHFKRKRVNCAHGCLVTSTKDLKTTHVPNKIRNLVSDI